MIPYYVTESMLDRQMVTIKRLWALCILLVVLLVGTNAMWIWYESRWEYFEATESVEQDIDAEFGDGDFTVIGMGDNYGESKSQANHNYHHTRQTKKDREQFGLSHLQYVSWNWKSEDWEMIPDNLSKNDIDDLIENWIIGKNAERDREILRRRLFDGICFEPLAEEFGLSVRQTKNIVYKCERKIFSHIK